MTSYLIVKGAAKAIEFYKQAFGATETFRMPQPDGRIGHAELKIGNSTIMLADEFPERNIHRPESLGGTPRHIEITHPQPRPEFFHSWFTVAAQEFNHRAVSAVGLVSYFILQNS